MRFARRRICTVHYSGVMAYLASSRCAVPICINAALDDLDMALDESKAAR